MAFHLSLFGLPQLRDDSGRVVKLRTHKQLALLVYLTLEGRSRPVSRETLIDLLWAEAPQSKARHSLSQALSAIRNALGGDSIKAERDTVRLKNQLSTDLDSDEILLGAQDARPLLELERAAGNSLGQWVDSARELCTNALRTALARQIDQARARGDLKSVHEYAAELYTIDPASHSAVLALAERQLLQGNNVEGVRIISEYITRMENEFGQAPHPETRLILRRIQRGENPSRKRIEIDHPKLRGEDAFYGRDNELAEIEGLWQEARHGHLRSCLVTGAPGIGKTSLVQRFATTVTARGALCISVSCQEAGSAIPYAVVSDIIRELCREPTVGGTDPAWLAEASRVYPAVRSHFPGCPEPAATSGDAFRFRVAEALFHMLEAVADGDTFLITLDDAHYLDHVSLATLQVLLRRLSDSPALVVVIRRTDAPPQSQPSSESVLTKWSHQVQVGPLSNDHLRTLIGTFRLGGEAPSDMIISEIAQLADGNPYFAELLVSDWYEHAQGSLVESRLAAKSRLHAWEPPETLRKAFARHSAGLAQIPRDLLHLLAVTGRGMQVREMLELTGWQASVLDRATVDLLNRGIVRFDRGHLAFKNELHRAFAYYEMTPDVRRFIHARVASHLVDTNDNDYRVGLHAAYHFKRADMIEEATKAVLTHASSAIAHGAPKEAEQAILDVATRAPASHLLLSEALVAQGRYEEALEELDAWQPDATDPEELARAWILRSKGLCLSGNHHQKVTAASSASRAVAAARQSRNPILILDALQIQAEIATDTGDTAVLRRTAQTVHLMAGRTSDMKTRAYARLSHGYCLMVTGQLASAERAFAEAADLLESLRLDTDLRRVWNGLGICLTGQGKIESAVKAFKRALEASIPTGDAHRQSFLAANLAVLYEWAGKFEEATTQFREAIRFCEQSSTARARATVFPNAAGLAMQLGEFDEADDLLKQSTIACTESGDWQRGAETAFLRADWHLARGEDEAAWPLVEQVVTREARLSNPLQAVAGWGRHKRHWTLVTSGPRALHELTERERGVVAALRVPERLDIQGFEEWALRDQSRANESNTVAELREMKFYGLAAGLILVDTAPSPLPKRTEGRSSAQQVVDFFAVPGKVPSEIGFRASSSELRHS